MKQSAISKGKGRKSCVTQNLCKTLSCGSMANLILKGGARLRFYGNAMPLGCPVVGPERFDAMWKNLRPRDPQYICMWGTQVELPRRQLCGGVNYRFSGEDHPPVEIPVEVDAEGTPFPVQAKDFLRFVQENMAADGVVYNQYLLNFYENGGEYIGWHSDDETQLDPNANIYCVTLCEGEARTFAVKSKDGAEKINLPLLNNSLIVMGAGMQKTHKHTVPKRKNCNGRRISITVRAVLSDMAK